MSTRQVPGRSAGRPPVAPSTPAMRLPPRRTTHHRDAAVLTGLGLIGAGLAPLVHMPELAVGVLAGGLAAGAARGLLGERRSRRLVMVGRLLESLAPLLGVRQPDRRLLQASGWTAGWPGVPRRIRIHYAPSAPDADPAWVGEVTRCITGRLRTAYHVHRHDRLRCRVELRRTETRDAPEVAPPYAQVRAERIVRELIGPTTEVTAVELDGEELRGIEITHQAGVKLAASGYRHRVERALSQMMPGRWRAAWDLENDHVRFEVRPSLPTSVYLPVVEEDSADLLGNYRQVRIPIAIDEDGREVLWYPGRVPHVMLTGGTGTGKTSAAHALLAQITSRGWPVWVCDAKRVEFLDLRGWPNVQIVAGSIPQQVAVIRRAWELMEYRYQLIEDGLAHVDQFEPLVVFLDEYAELRSNLLEWYAEIKVKGDPTRPPTFAEVASLARKGRTARIHLVLSTQRPDAEFLGGEMRDNFGFRISMGRLSPQGAMMMWENPAAGVSLPRGCTGRAMATHDDGRVVEVQCYRFPSLHSAAGSEECDLLERLRPGQERAPRLLIIEPEPTEGQQRPTFRQYARAEWVLAASRPDLDRAAGGGQEGAPDGHRLASPLASLGLADTDGQPPVASPVVDAPAPVGDHDAGRDATAWDAETDDYGEDYLGYTPATACSPRSVTVGDLIEVDDSSGIWGVVDEMPEDDLAEPGCIAISWRGDGDESGFLSIPEDSMVQVRRPEEDA